MKKTEETEKRNEKWLEREEPLELVDDGFWVWEMVGYSEVG